jgi:hypothetical protein
MSAAPLLKPAGIAAAVFFMLSFISGIEKFNFTWLHTPVSKIAFLLAALHTYFSIKHKVFEPTCVLLILFMLLATVTGPFKPLFKLHVIFSILALAAILLHLWLILS